MLAVKPGYVAETAARGRRGRLRSGSCPSPRGSRPRRSRPPSAAPLPVVRAMPNTPALIGAGAAAISPGAHAGEEDLAWAEAILGAVGVVVRVPEKLAGRRHRPLGLRPRLRLPRRRGDGRRRRARRPAARHRRDARLPDAARLRPAARRGRRRPGRAEGRRHLARRDDRRGPARARAPRRARRVPGRGDGRRGALARARGARRSAARPRRAPGRGSPGRARAPRASWSARGAMRNVPPMLAQLDDVHVQAELEAARGDRARRARASSALVSRSSTSSRPCMQAAAADVADDRRGGPASSRRPVAQQRALRAPRRAPTPSCEHVEHRVADRGDQRVGRRASCRRGSRARGRAPRSRALVTTAASGRPAPSVLDSVRMSGTTPSRSKRVPVAGAAQAGLRLVEDQQHPARVAVVAQRGEVARAAGRRRRRWRGSARRCRRRARPSTGRRSARSRGRAGGASRARRRRSTTSGR